MGFNIERVNKPFVVKSPYKPSGDQPKAIEELATRIENGENDVVLMGATGTGKTATTTTTTSRKRTFPRPTPTSRRIPTSTTMWSDCATPPPRTF